jgi:hypothetical protein
MSAREHKLKTWPEPFAAVLDGRKTFEYRVDDRGFAVGDILVLEEWDPTPSVYQPRGYTARKCRVRVTYLLSGKCGVPANCACMSIVRADSEGA